jgi:hypothetical protein
MKTKSQTIGCFTKWFENNTVGNMVIYHAPNSSECEVIIEQVVKAREMKPEVRAAFEFLMDELGIERGEVFRDKDGKPDRIKLTRRFDGND